MSLIKKIIPVIIIIGLLYWFFLKTPTNHLTDNKATIETVNLFNNLKKNI